MVKKGAAWAVCFYLKAKCGWRDSPDPAGVNVNIGVADEEHIFGSVCAALFPLSACVVKVNNCVEEPLECGQATRSTERAKSLTN